MHKTLNIYHKHTVSTVSIGSAIEYSDQVYLLTDGAVLLTAPGIAGSRVVPGDFVYQVRPYYDPGGAIFTFDRDVAFNRADELLKSGNGVGVLNNLIEASRLIDRNYTAKSPGLSSQSLEELDIFHVQKDWRYYRYKRISDCSTTSNLRRAAEEITAKFGNNEPDEGEIKDYYLNKCTEELKMVIGGYLHLTETSVRMCDRFLRSIRNWKDRGGYIGWTALKAIANYTGDQTELIKAEGVYR